MENWKLYSKIAKKPESIEALQNTDILSKEYVRYSDALLVLEKQKFYNSLVEEKNFEYRHHLDWERIHLSSQYFERCNLSPSIKEAELQRTLARNCLNEAIYKGFIKSFILKFDTNKVLNNKPNKLSADWWKSKNSFRIDGLSLYFLKSGEKTFSEGIIILDRKGLEKWGAAYPEEPNVRGRRKGTSYNDLEQIEYMKEVMLETKCSRNAAAKQAVKKFGYRASIESDERRLNSKFSKTYPKMI